ncbi:aldehyde dehydrogenase [Ensifer sp. ENS05]|uniref:thiamine pyrophosphate-dependent enzyme n=1 Tax=Ensifer sp. ENS05 TaxID=2769277 RepID=UPI00177C19E5|nr:thiamine pyrophosphate-dependent enzyme [Ensifer sp. ENS05]MBD9597345.1 aldehyde dehydrogenase [Ensifer sp. ENS05]
MGEVIIGGPLDRRDVVKTLLSDRKDLLVVTGLGSSAYDVMAAGDHDNNYYLWAAMGSAAMVGLGIASAQPDKNVLVVTGDGEALMGFGALATIALRKPKNLTIAILDNGHFGETGMQVSHAGRGISLDRVAQSCGFCWTSEIQDMEGVEDLRERVYAKDGLKLATIKIKAENLPRVLPPRDGAYIKNRFRASLGFQPI